MRHYYTENQVQEMINRYLNGETQESISQNFGCNKTTIGKILSKNNIEARKSKIEFTDEQKEDIISQYQEGLNTVQLAKKFNYSQQTISRALLDWGIELRPRIKTRKPGEPNKRELTGEQKQYIISEFNSGRTIKSIAEEYSVWTGIVKKVLIDNGLKTRKYVEGTQEQIDTMIRLYKEGAALKDFEDILGINKWASTKLLRDNGVEIRKSGKKGQVAPEGMKQCGKCQKYKPTSEFHSNVSSSDRLQSLCKPCAVESCKIIRRRKQFQLDPDGWDKMYKEQKGLCAICGQPERRERLGVPIQLAIDHDHITGKIRQLLCANCNQMIGLSYDNPEVLLSAAMYLERHKEN